MNQSTFVGKLRFFLIDLLRGTSVLKVLNELNVHQYLSREELKKIGQQKLKDQFELARRTTRYYRDFNSIEEVPMLTKGIVKERFEDFLSDSYKGKLIRKTTGGSTGVPFAYYATPLTQSYMWASIIFAWQMAGYRLGDRVAFFAGSSLIKNDWKHKVFYKLLNVDTLFASPLTADIMTDYAARIEKNKVTVIYGYAYVFNAFADYLHANPGQRFPALKGIVCTAEVLTDKMRQNIESAFHVKVYNQYGCDEGGVSAFECDHGNLHLVSDRCAYESDKYGSLLATDITNKGFIMMKYNTTDLVTFSDEACACKRGFPVITEVVGRITDIVIDLNNNVLHASFFGILFSKDSTIKQFQIVFDHNDIEVNIHSDAPDEQKYAQKYINLLQQHAKFNSYKLSINQPFVTIQNGKHKEVVDNRKKLAIGLKGMQLPSVYGTQRLRGSCLGN